MTDKDIVTTYVKTEKVYDNRDGTYDYKQELIGVTKTGEKVVIDSKKIEYTKMEEGMSQLK